ncbi:MAG: PLP-dependent transferase [Phycisphaerae bacterium]|nr:PLP-dependent transferase [Phycisphaerae bacterium]
MNLTDAIHGGSNDPGHWGPSVVPIYQTASFSQATAQELADVFAGRKSAYAYSRSSNPTTGALERRLTQLEQGVGSIAMASGMAAISAVMLGLLKAGDEVVASQGLFGGSLTLLTKTLSRFGVCTRFVDASDTDAVTQAVTDRTRLIFVETIGNPKMDVPDIKALARIARDAGVPLVVDSTVTPPCMFKGIDLGADLLVYSTTKFINGHGTAIGGAIVDTGRYDWSAGPFEHIVPWAEKVGPLAFLAYLRNATYRDLGSAAAPFNSFLMSQGLETLCMRMARHCEQALRLAKFLEAHETVSWVHYPGLSQSPFHERVQQQFGGHGGALLTFGLGSKARAYTFIDAVTLALNQTNIGDAKTLVIHPASTIYHDFTGVQQQDAGVTEDLIRVSVGLEEYQDIEGDFRQALQRVKEVHA